MSADLLREAAKVMLVRNEGLRLKPYKDTAGNITIGVGRNLDEVGVTRREALMLLDNDLDTAISGVKAIFGEPFYEEINDVRRLALIDLVFNLGRGGLLSFHYTVRAILKKDWALASENLLASKYAKQVGSRANRNAFMLNYGVMPNENQILT